MTDLRKLHEFIDLDRYPIDRLTSAEGEIFLASCHEQMHSTTLCALPGFIRDNGVAAIREELEQLAPMAHQHDYLATAYSWRDNSAFTKDHPRGAVFIRNCGILTTEQFDGDGPSTRLFHFDELTNCVRAILKFNTLYRSACPTLSIQANVMSANQGFGWHFDTNDGVVSFLIQEADEGGDFNYAPLIRSEDDENYDGIAELFEGCTSGQITDMPAGTFSLFLGRRSAHRVTPVVNTRKPRLSLLFSYDQQPGMVFPKTSCDRIRYPDNRPYYGSGPEPKPAANPAHA